jgi:aminoglycoside 3-N-acetyltransferase
MDKRRFLERFVADLGSLGVRPGSVLLVHSSLKSIGQVPGGAETVIQGLLIAIGEAGTLLMPALTYEAVRSSNPVFDVRTTPSCVGIITETFRLREGTRRSLHPTHSVCAVGPLTEELLSPHIQDSTPCGPNSPFHRLPEFEGQILMLGCGLQPNTSIHALEEMIEPPYLFSSPMTYTLVDNLGNITKKEYTPHNFFGWKQRYERVADILKLPDLQTGIVLKAQSYLIEASALKHAVLQALRENPLFFVEKITPK